MTVIEHVIVVIEHVIGDDYECCAREHTRHTHTHTPIITLLVTSKHRGLQQNFLIELIKTSKHSEMLEA